MMSKTVICVLNIALYFFPTCLAHPSGDVIVNINVAGERLATFTETDMKTGRGLQFQNALMNLVRGSGLENLPFRRRSSSAADISNATVVRNEAEVCSTWKGETGTCQPAALCTSSGGRSIDSCSSGLVCCADESPKCSVEARLNNTYWTSPSDYNVSSTSCVMTVALDRNLPEQKQTPICQIRLDFIEFSIAQPDQETVCSTDSFQVSGANNVPPVICGDNDGQHMYLFVTNSSAKSSNIQLTFNFGDSPLTRKWKIRVALLPCGADYLAPSECLQYITEPLGRVWSFNWLDTKPSTRQLANQDYQICFRTEKLGDYLANTQCVRPCTTSNGGEPFVLSGSGSPFAVSNDRSQGAALSFCMHDYLVIPGGSADDGESRDKFCGGQLSTKPNSRKSQKICSTAQPFRLIYHTNGDETISFPAGQRDYGANDNVGFCVSFQQIAS